MSLLDQILFAGDPIKLDREIEWPTNAWGFACLLGETISQIKYGYPDSFDGVDYDGYAGDVFREERGKPYTYRQMLTDWVETSGEDPEVKAYLKDNLPAGEKPKVKGTFIVHHNSAGEIARDFVAEGEDLANALTSLIRLDSWIIEAGDKLTFEEGKKEA